MEFSGERVVLDYEGFDAELIARTAARGGAETGLRAEVERTIARHLARYYFVEAMLARREGPLRILDVACGTGYGSYILSGRGLALQRVAIGVDLDAESIAYATARFTRPDLSLEFRRGDCRDLPWSTPEFDVIASFETLEHLTQSDGARFIERLAALLRPRGFVALSTPPPSRRRNNPFHLHEYERDELAALLGAHFQYVQLFEQGVVMGSAILPLPSGDAPQGDARQRVDAVHPLSPAPLVVAPPSGVAPPPAIRNHVAVCGHDPLPPEIASAIYCFDSPAR